MQRRLPGSVRGLNVAVFNWRDTTNPEGGGSERYVEQVARGLAERGAQVTVFCAAHDRAPADEVVDGVRFRRRGGKMSVYVQGLLHLLFRRLGPVDVVVDVQNGLPFFTRLATRKPVVVLVHHVHREQWPVVYPGLMGKVGWWIESRLAPKLYARSQYVAVSHATRAELAQLGVDENRITIVHNGTETAPRVDTTRTPYPSLCVVGRLVPHKRVEHALDVVVALRGQWPDVRLTVVGDGWWLEQLTEYAARVEASDLVTFVGHVEEHQKHEIYARSWVMLLPSLKEGWGLVVGEAGSHGVPTVAYAAAGGTRESVHHDRSGILVDDEADFTAAVARLLKDRELLEQLGEGAREVSHQFTWEHTRAGFADVIRTVAD